MRGLDPRQIENVVDQAGQAFGFLDHDLQELVALGRPRSGLSSRISENERIEVSGVRSSWLTVVVMNSSFSRSSSVRRWLARFQLVRRDLERSRFALQLAAVFDHLGRLLEDRQDLVGAEVGAA